MTDGTYRLSVWQLAVLAFVLGLCVSPLAFPGVIDRQLGREGWLVGLPAVGVGLWGTLAAVGLARRFPGRPFDRIVMDLLGRVSGSAYLALLALLMAGGAAVNLHLFAQVSAASELTRLPPAYPAVLTGAVGSLAAYFGPEVVARTGEALIPVIGPGLLAILVPLLLEGHAGRLLPLRGLPSDRFLGPETLAMLGSIRGFLPLLVLGPFCRTPPRAWPLCVATAAAGAVVTASFAIPITLFGARFTVHQRYPFLAAVGTLTWRWLPIHNLVVVSMFVWHAVSLVAFAAYLWLGAWLLLRLWPGLPWIVLVLALAAAETAGAALQLPSNVTYEVAAWWNYAVVVLGVLAPTLLWALAARRPRSNTSPRGREAEDAA